MDATQLCDVNLRSALLLREYRQGAARALEGSPRRVLDWGAGFGIFSSELRALAPEVEVASYDYDATAPGTVRVPFDHFPDLEVTRSPDPVALPYPDAHFDVAVSFGTLEHVQWPDASLRELRRVLVPGGLLLVYKLPNRYSYIEWLTRRRGRGYWHGMYQNDRVYSTWEAGRLLERHGFEVLSLRRENLLPLTRLGVRVPRLAPQLWRLNRLLARVGPLSHLATNITVEARAAAT